MKLEDLENYRDENGYINIDRTGFSGNSDSREIRGSQEREKDWMNLYDASILLRTELFTDDETQNYCNYAELIFEELARQIDFPATRYDLITYKGKKGGLSQRVNKENEDFFPLANFVDSPKGLEDYSSVSIDLENIFKDFKKMIDENYQNLDVIKYHTDNFKLVKNNKYGALFDYRTPLYLITIFF